MLMFIDFGIFEFIVELARVESPTMFVGFLSFAFFSGLVSGLILCGIYQVRTMNKLMNMGLKEDGPLVKLLDKAESLTGNGRGGPNNEQIQNMVGSVFGALGLGAPPDKTDDLGLNKRRRGKNGKRY